MPRYVMANRRAGKFTSDAKRASRDAMATTLSSSIMSGATVVRENQPEEESRHVVIFEADAAEMDARIREMPDDVLCEPEILHHPLGFMPQDFIGFDADTLDGPMNFGDTRKLEIKVKGAGAGLPGAAVTVFLRAFGIGRRVEGVTNSNGSARFEFSNVFQVSAVIVVPVGKFWPMVFRGVRGGSLTAECPPLAKAVDGLGWWHEMVGLDRIRSTAGRGIRVGVIDSGVGPHPALSHVKDVGAFIDGEFDPDGGADSGSHGSHVNGTIGARPDASTRFSGVAPGARLFSARVFPPNGGASQADIANAIDLLSRDHEADLINMSLGAPVGSSIEQDAIIDALERGTLCVCAAGNSDGPVEFPAAFPETVAVAALGLLGFGPPDSIPRQRLPSDFRRFGDDMLFHANFSCFGDEVTCAAPGVGIISTVPERFGLNAPYASMGGTSMASPTTCGALASQLSSSDAYKSLPRDRTRSSMALRILRQSCVDKGFDAEFQGAGVPQAR